MTREKLISAQDEKLRKCIQTRNSALRGLFRSTTFLAAIQSDALEFCEIDLLKEESFLQANDLSKGRSFDPSTLPPFSSKILHGPTLPDPHQKSVTTVEPRQANEGNLKVRETSIRDTRNVGDTNNAHRSPSVGAAQVDETTEVSPLLASIDTPDVKSSATSHQKDEEPTVGATVDETGRLQEHNPAEQQRDAPLVSTSVSKNGDARSSTEQVTSIHNAGAPPCGSETLEGGRTPVEIENISSPLRDIDEAYLNNKDTRHAAIPGQASIEHADTVRSLEKVLASATVISQADNTLQNNTDVSHSQHPRSDSVSRPTPVFRREAEGSLISEVGSKQLDSIPDGTLSTHDQQLQVEEQRPTQGPPQEKDQILSLDSANTVEPGLDQLHEQEADFNTSQVARTEFSPFKSFRQEPSQVELAAEASALRDHVYPGMSRDHSKDLTFSQRPPMRIDTGSTSATDSQTASGHKKAATPGAPSAQTPPNSATAAKSSHLPYNASSPPERMTTRVSSGALRHKSVSEILGETPRSLASHTEKFAVERGIVEGSRDDYSIQSPKSSGSIASPDSTTFRLRLNEMKEKEKEKSKLSTVIFARQQSSNTVAQRDQLQVQNLDAVESKIKNKEYFLPLFTAQAATPPQSQLLNRLIGSASKTLTTANHFTDFHEQQDCRILNKIYHLQNTNKWSLRQLERSLEPDRKVVHWDVLLSQMKWMRTDFREERKWKISAARSIANLCAEWVASSKEERTALQVKVRAPNLVSEMRPGSAATPELIPSAEDDSSDAAEDEIYSLDISQMGAPAAIFSLAPDMFYFGLEKTPITDKILQELPLYQPSVDIQQAALYHINVQPDREWKKPLLPLSKYVDGKITSHEEGPPRKKSRYAYADLEDEFHPSSREEVYSSPTVHNVHPEKNDVALFNPENKHIRDRIHAGHAFRPPTEHQMPTQSFFEARQSSQWTQTEDDELRKLVREYAYNWSLVSSCLSVPSILSSGAERRTPWECFERWIGLEGLPAEMSKTQYFRMYLARLQAAQRTHEAQQQAMQQQQSNSAPHMTLRRRSTQPFLVERRKNTKHVHLVNAMKNLAKKRETALSKQQHVAGLAAMRKPPEPTQIKNTMHTPQELSRIKHEREMKMQEAAKTYRQQVLQQQKVAAAQRATLQAAQHTGGTTAIQPGRNPMQAVTNGNSPANNPTASSIGQSNTGNQTRQPQIIRPPNSIQTNGSMPPNPQGVPHAPMQASHMPVPPRPAPQMGSDSMRIYHEATRVQAEQQRYLQQQRQQQHGQPNGQISPNIGLLPQNNSANYSGLQGRSGSPSMNGAPTTSGPSSSPRMSNHTQSQSLSSGMIPTINQIAGRIRSRYPQYTPEQISLMATDQLKQYHVTHAAAIQAAAGGNINASSISNNGLNNSVASSQQQPPTAMMNGTQLSTQQYAQMIRNQQQHQRNQNGGTAFNGQRPASRSATPQIHRTPSATGRPPSQSPVPSQAQLAGGQ